MTLTLTLTTASSVRQPCVIRTVSLSPSLTLTGPGVTTDLSLSLTLAGPGVTTDEIDRVVHETHLEAGAYPAPLHYHDFPKSYAALG